MPFRFAPVALDVKFSLCFYRLRFLTFGLFLWCGFFISGKWSPKMCFFGAVVQFWSPYPFLIWKLWRRAVWHAFLRSNSRLDVSFKFGSCPFGFSVLSHKFRAIFQYLGVYKRLRGQRANKQFKWDSARMAFLVCGWFRCWSAMRKLGHCVLHPLTGR